MAFSKERLESNSNLFITSFGKNNSFAGKDKFQRFKSKSRRLESNIFYSSFESKTSKGQQE